MGTVLRREEGSFDTDFLQLNIFLTLEMDTFSSFISCDLALSHDDNPYPSLLDALQQGVVGSSFVVA